MDDLADTSLAGFLQFADDGTIIKANRRLCEITGYAPEEIAGKRVESILSVGGRIFYQTHLFPILRLHGRADEIYLSLRSASGAEVPVLINSARKETDGIGVIECVMIPIRQRSHYEDEILRAKKAAEVAAQAKDEFLAMVSHDLRTPLNAILGWVSILQKARLDEEAVNKALATVERNARSQSKLIEDILDFSRATAGKLRLDVSNVQPIDILQQALEVVRPAADAKGIRLQPVFDPKAGPVSGDPERLQQVMWNLLSNAVKFTPKGGRVQVRLERVNSHVEIIVSDSGKGISPDFLPYVFDRFRQAESSTQRQGGLGLGMAITRQIVELHGGSIRAESPGEGEGATFIVELPIINIRDAGSPLHREHPVLRPAGEDDEACSPRLDGMHILIVDDEYDARELLSTMLSQCGAVVTEAGSAAEALNQLQLVKPDVLVSDIGMRGEDGYSLIRAVRALEAADIRSTPAIALTGQARFSDRMRALLAGYQMHVPKPVEPAELITLIANLGSRAGSKQDR